MLNNSKIVNRRIILTAEQLNSRQLQSNNLMQAELARRNEHQIEAGYLPDIDENENYLLGYN